MYKTTHFSLLKPINNKPIMLDDTCYFIGFENLDFARVAQFLLNHEHTQLYLKSIIFSDAKRPITKDVLMRLDLKKIYNLFDINQIKQDLDNIRDESWEKFGRLLQSEKYEQAQLALF